MHPFLPVSQECLWELIESSELSLKPQPSNINDHPLVSLIQDHGLRPWGIHELSWDLGEGRFKVGAITDEDSPAGKGTATGSAFGVKVCGVAWLFMDVICVIEIDQSNLHFFPATHIHSRESEKQHGGPQSLLPAGSCGEGEVYYTGVGEGYSWFLTTEARYTSALNNDLALA